MGDGQEEETGMRRDVPRATHRDQSLTIFRTSFGWAGVAVSEQGICRIVLPKTDKEAVEKELKSAECGVLECGNS